MTIEFNSSIIKLFGGDKLKISLRAARVNANLTLLEAAEKLGIGKDTLIKWEKEPWNISALYQQKISEVYSIPIDMINFFPDLIEFNSIIED